MLTKDDKGWLATTFVTRDEHRTDITELKESYSRIEGMFNAVMTMLDPFTNTVARVDQENKIGSVVIARHTRQIEEIAHKTHVTLSE